MAGPLRTTDFSSAGWRYLVLLGLGTAAFYNFAPAPGEDTYLARFIAHYMTPAEVWRNYAEAHLLLSAESAQEALLVADARPPPVHRFRYPQ